jgi:hypothetical protein
MDRQLIKPFTGLLLSRYKNVPQICFIVQGCNGLGYKEDGEYGNFTNDYQTNVFAAMTKYFTRK